jgi:hypothetical protein
MLLLLIIGNKNLEVFDLHGYDIHARCYYIYYSVASELDRAHACTDGMVIL